MLLSLGSQREHYNEAVVYVCIWQGKYLWLKLVGGTIKLRL